MKLNQQQQQMLNELRAKAIRKTIIVILIIATPFYILYRCDENDKEKYESEFHESDIVDLSTFSKYVTIQAKDYCKKMNEIRQITNSDKKSLETGKLIEWVAYFQNSTIRDIGMNNDLSDDIVSKAQDIFVSELRKCGYFESDYSEEGNNITNDESDYSSSDSYDDEYYQNEPMDDGYNEEENNSISTQNENIESDIPKFQIYSFQYPVEYSVAETECAKKQMRLPNYEELYEIGNSSELLKNLKPYDKSISYWSSTEYKEGQNYSRKESNSGDEPKKYKKNYNPYTENIIMTDISLSRNCICIE
jgi:hypothetical protein